MVAINDIRQTNSEYYSSRPLVAVFVGGTQGIGRYAIEALARLYSRQPDVSLRVYILGRNKASADEVLQSCREKCARGEFIFIQAENLGLLRDVDGTSKRIIQLEREKDGENARIDLLVQTQAQILFGSRKDTGEGLDQMMSLAYYSRLRFVTQLLPLLNASKDPHIISIDAAGMAGNLYRDDLSLRGPGHYNYMNVKSHASYMTTFAFEKLASENQRLAFVYMYPGAVIGPAHYDVTLPWWFKLGRMIMLPLVRWTFATPAEESGDRTLFLATSKYAPASTGSGNVKGTNGEAGSGCYAVGRLCDPVSNTALYPKVRDGKFSREVWTHTTEAFNQIEKNGKFTS